MATKSPKENLWGEEEVVENNPKENLGAKSSTENLQWTTQKYNQQQNAPRLSMQNLTKLQLLTLQIQ